MPPLRAVRHLPPLAFAVVVLSGQVLDRTTHQPLRDVSVDVFSAGSAAHGHRAGQAVTDADGRFRVSGLRRSAYRIDLVSDDVPHASSTVHVDTDHPQPVHLYACSTTLDYSCAAPGGGLPESGS